MKHPWDRYALGLLILMGVVQCHSLPAFETAPAPLAKGRSESATARVAVCYNSLTATANEVRAIAANACEPGTAPKAIERDMNMRNCPILTPTRVTFVCIKPEPEAREE